MTREEALAKLKSLPKFPSTSMLGFLPSAVIESRVKHLKPVQQLYMYIYKLNARISNYQYTGNKIKVEVQVPFPMMNSKDMADVAVYVELEPKDAG